MGSSKIKLEFNRSVMPNWQARGAFNSGRGVWTHDDLPTSVDPIYLYRYMPVESAVLTFMRRNLFLRAPRLWDDPYEAWWSAQLFRPGSKLLKAHAFGLCWTIRDSDEPFWRTYMCPKEPTVPAVRLRSTVAKLTDRMARLAAGEKGKAYLGVVRYKPAAKLKAIAKRLAISPDDQVAHSAARGLLWKRRQFEMEQEVRLLWIVTDPTNKDYFELQFDHIEVIDQVMIGPSTDPIKRLSAYRKLRRAGVPRHLFEFSTIYDSVL